MLMTFEEILKDLKNKKYYPIYLFFGEEPYFIDELCNYIIENVIPPEEKCYNQNILYGKDSNINSIKALALNFPMVGNQQLIVVKEAQSLKEFSSFESYLNHYSNKSIVVFCYKDKIDQRTSFYKKMEKISVVFESKKVYENKISEWIQNWLKPYKLTIKPEANRLLYEHVGSNLSILNSEMKKLLVVIKTGQTQITEDDIVKNIGINRQYNNFELNKALGLKNRQQCYKIINYLGNSDAEKSLTNLISNLFAYFTKLIIYHTLIDKSEANVKKELEIQYFVDDYRKAALNYTMPKLIAIISYLKEADLRTKGIGVTSVENENILKELVFKILN